MGRMIENHRAEGTHVRLFVRPTANAGGKAEPFVYCGELEFDRWEDDRPITVWWTLVTAVPANARELLQVPAAP
jgi:hypothetical protein